MGNRLDMFLEVTGGEELYRVKKTEGERRMKEQPSPANADEQGIVKGEGCFLEYDYFSIPA